MGRYYFRSLRIAAWGVAVLLAGLASVYTGSPAGGEPLAYYRVERFLKLALAVAVALPVIQGLRLALTPLQGRLRLPPEKAAFDSWAFQLWGPLMLENLVYGVWLLFCLANASLQLVLLPVPEPWQGAHPPWAPPDPDRFWLVGKLYVGALLATVAAAYLRLSVFASESNFSGLQFLVIGATLLLLGAILVPNFVRARARGRLTACKSNLKNIGTALEMYSTDHEGRYPPSPNELLPNYLKTIPTCPTVGWVTYQFQMASTPDLYTVVCAGHNHGGSGVTAPNYPQYTSITGLIERP